MKRHTFVISLLMLVLGAGCNNTPQPIPSYKRDAELFSRISTTTVYKTPPPGPFIPGPAEHIPPPQPMRLIYDQYGQPHYEPVPQPAPQPTTPPQPATPSTAANAPVTVHIDVTPRSSSGSADQYSWALSIYKERGSIFQFVECRGTPGSLSIKRGVQFMLDNRDAKPHVIGVGSTKFVLGPYDYVIATAQMLGVNFITCDGGGSAQLIVQQ